MSLIPDFAGFDPYWYDEEISAIYLGGVRSPGSVFLSGHDRPEEWDVQAAKGSSGATTTLQGAAPGKFTASFHLVGETTYDRATGLPEANDFDRWESFQRLIESTTAGPVPIALPIYHPDLARNRFTEVVNGGIGGLIHDGKGGAVVTVQFLEYRPARPTRSRAATGGAATGAAGAAGGSSGAEAPDPNAARRDRLLALLDAAKAP